MIIRQAGCFALSFSTRMVVILWLVGKVNDACFKRVSLIWCLICRMTSGTIPLLCAFKSLFWIHLNAITVRLLPSDKSITLWLHCTCAGVGPGNSISAAMKRGQHYFFSSKNQTGFCLAVFCSFLTTITPSTFNIPLLSPSSSLPPPHHYPASSPPAKSCQENAISLNSWSCQV